MKYSASGGITVKSGVITAKKVTKKKKPAKFTVSCGKKKAVVYVNVEK